jgi:LysM repeat protein
MISQALVVVLISFVALAILAYVNRPTKPKQVADNTPAPTEKTNDPQPDTTPTILKTETPSAHNKPGALAPDQNKPGASAPDSSLQNNSIARTNNPAQQPTTQPTAQNKSWDDLLPNQDPKPKLIPLANVSTDPADAQKQLQAGNLLAARQALNAQLISAGQNESQTADLKKQIHELNKTIIFSTKRFADDPFGGSYAVQNGDALQKIAKAHNVTWELLGRMNDISDPRKLRAGRAIKIINGPFNAVVSKSKFTMDVWLGEPMSSDAMFVGTFNVGLGKDASTPAGTWIVTPGGKQKNPKFWGAAELAPMEADDPQNPLGEFWLALTGVDGDAEGREGFGIHGTIDPSSIGKNASLGCIRLAKDDIAMVYELLVDGKSKVVVKD